VFEPAVIGLDPVAGILLDVMPRGGDQLVKDERVDRGGVGDDLGGITFKVVSARSRTKARLVLRRCSAVSQPVDKANGRRLGVATVPVTALRHQGVDLRESGSTVKPVSGQR
jgi:hypothetical protein